MAMPGHGKNDDETSRTFGFVVVLLVVVCRLPSITSYYYNNEIGGRPQHRAQNNQQIFGSTVEARERKERKNTGRGVEGRREMRTTSTTSSTRTRMPMRTCRSRRVFLFLLPAILLLAGSPPSPPSSRRRRVSGVRVQAWTPSTAPTRGKQLLPARIKTASATTTTTTRLRSFGNGNGDNDSESERPLETAAVPSKRMRQIASWFVAFQIAFGAALALPSPLAPLLPHGQTANAAETQQQEQVASVSDEVWTLMNKYYLDKGNHAGEWSKLYSKYYNTNNLNGVSDMVKQMVAGDDGAKYNRILTPDEYSYIQRFDLIGVGATLMPEQQQPTDQQGGDSSPSSSAGDASSASQQPNPPSGRIMVGAPPIPKSPADRAGLEVGDVVLEVNGVSTVGKTAFDIIDQITETDSGGGSDQQKSTVTMTILPKYHADVVGDAAKQYSRQVTMERTIQEAVQNPVRYKLVRDGDVGYIRISEFNSMVVPKLQEAVKELVRKRGAEAIVLDLRHNTGGAFQSAIEISSLFLADKVATYVVDNTQTRLPFTTAKNQVIIDSSIPIVVWMDGKSASAAEVLAGSLHDNCRAVLVGQNSFGKGLIQAVYGLRNGAGLVLTVARYLTPAGYNIQGQGISPDIEISQSSPSLLGFVPDLGDSDANKLDLNDIRQRLSPSMCQAPSIAATATAGATATATSN